MSSAGHNSAGAQIRAYIERVERLNEEKAALLADIREVFAEAKGDGFDVKVLRAIIRDRAKDPADLAEFNEVKETYEAQLG